LIIHTQRDGTPKSENNFQLLLTLPTNHAQSLTHLSFQKLPYINPAVCFICQRTAILLGCTNCNITYYSSTAKEHTIMAQWSIPTPTMSFSRFLLAGGSQMYECPSNTNTWTYLQNR